MRNLQPLRYDFACPLCERSTWMTLHRRLYRLSDIDSQTPYTGLRYRVLFEVWFPYATTIAICARACGHCGFVALVPRPGEIDIEKKYRWLEDQRRAGHNDGAIEYNGRRKLLPDKEYAVKRAESLFSFISESVPLSSGKGVRVLDVGGASGALLSPFIDRNCECFVVDDHDCERQGVRHLGRRIDSVPTSMKFDVIICSHVLEHVSAPKRLLSSIGGFLETDGLLYLEIPMELKRSDFLPDEPVTHISFFSEKSLEFLANSCGLAAIKSSLETRTLKDPPDKIVRMLCRPGRPGDQPDPKASLSCTLQLLALREFQKDSFTGESR